MNGIKAAGAGGGRPEAHFREQPMGAGAAAAAAAAQRQREEEEEAMTPYARQELDDDWEFKIVRANTGVFGNAAVFQRLIDEEARAGWQLVEKFDNSRVRFKRPRSARQRDAALPPGVDPYRVRYGLSEGAYVLLVLLAVFGGLGLLMLGVFLIEAASR
jgi:hypothetical protein